jgi:hypothetical protein
MKRLADAILDKRVTVATEASSRYGIICDLIKQVTGKQFTPSGAYRVIKRLDVFLTSNYQRRIRLRRGPRGAAGKRARPSPFE